jgi:hypothetical protein
MSDPIHNTFGTATPPEGWLRRCYTIRPSSFSPGRAVEWYAPDGEYLGECCIDTDNAELDIRERCDGEANYRGVIRFARDGSAVLLDSVTWEVIGRWRGERNDWPSDGFYPAGGAA